MHLKALFNHVKRKRNNKNTLNPLIMKTNTEEEALKEQLLKDIKDIQWNIDYHEKKLAEYTVKMQISEYALRQLTKQEYGTV